MMLEYLGEVDAANAVEDGVKKVVAQDLKSLSAGRMGCSTSEVGDLVAGYIMK
jgi:3-isopropylmalate dehydrogenase